jgi:hypothetical protein
LFQWMGLSCAKKMAVALTLSIYCPAGATTYAMPLALRPSPFHNQSTRLFQSSSSFLMCLCA